MPRGRGKFLKNPWAVQRLELLMSGVEVPKFGTLKDKILRDFLLKQSQKEVAKNRVTTLALIGILAQSKASKAAIDLVVSNWTNYVNQEYYMEGVVEERENDMRAEYDQWRDVRPKVKFKKNKKGEVAMALSVSSLTPKIKE